MHKDINKNAKVSIIIPAFNAAGTISETIDSILKQTYKNIEIIVVDDGSTDSTKLISESYGQKVKYIYQENSGGGSSPRNNGYRHSIGSFLHFFDADDIMQPTNIEEKINYLLENPTVSMVFSNYRNFRKIKDNISLAESHFSSCTFLNKSLPSLISEGTGFLAGKKAAQIMLIENFTISGAVMFTRKVFEAVGGYDENLTASEDFDIHYRVLLAHNCGIINNVGFHRRFHSDNMSSNSVVMCLNGIKSAQKLILLEPSAGRRRLLQRRIIVRLMVFSRYYRGKDTKKSLSYCLRALRYYRGFNKSTLSQFVRNLIAALIQRD